MNSSDLLFIAKPDKYDLHTLSEYLISRDENEVIAAINVLLEATFSRESNYSLSNYSEEAPVLVQSLVICFERHIGWISGDNSSAENELLFDYYYKKKSCVKRKREYIRRANLDYESKYDELTKSVWEPITRADECIHLVSIDNYQERFNAFDDFDWDEKQKFINWHKFCQTKFSNPVSACTSPHILLKELDSQIIQCIVMIIRNMSFVAANNRYLGQSVDVLRLLGGCLHYRFSSLGGAALDSNVSGVSGSGSSSTSTSSNICLHSIQTLANISHHLDISGCKLWSDIMFLDENLEMANESNNSDTQSTSGDQDKEGKSNKIQPNIPEIHSFGLGGMLLAKQIESREENIPIKLSQNLIRSRVWPHILANFSLMSPLMSCITDCINTNRPIVMHSLELMKDIMSQQQDYHSENGTNPNIFLNVPDHFLSRLVDLLYLPRLGPDSAEYPNPVTTMVSRVTTLKLHTGYDTIVDYELRDRSAELLDRLTSLSSTIKLRVGKMKRVYDYLLEMLRTRVGRSDAVQLAGSLLSNILTLQENKKLGLSYLEQNLLEIASKDNDVAKFVCNRLMN